VTIAYSDFVTNFPEFSNTTNYSQGQVEFYLNLGYQLCSSPRWGSLQDQGVQLFTAHNIALARQRAKAAATGGVPGVTQGVVSAKAVDKVSAGYDAQNVTLEKGGDFNLTTYGLQYLRLARMVGAGGAQL